MRLDGKSANLSDYKNLFKACLTRINKDIISDKTIPESDMSLWISGRRASTSELSNQIMDQVAIDMNNRWRKREQEKGVDTSMGIRENYTQVKNSLPTQLR